MKFFEEYEKCGCVSKQVPKASLSGYCDTHGNNPSHVYRSDGKLIWDWRIHTLNDHPAHRHAALKGIR